MQGLLGNKIIRIVTGLIFGGAIVFGAPVVPTEMEWVKSYETLLFNTADGDLSLDEYALHPTKEGTYLVRVGPKNESQITDTTSPRHIRGKKLVSIAEGSAYYSEFRKKSGEIVREKYNKGAYKDLGRFKNAPQPRKTELLGMGSAFVAESAPTYSSEQSGECGFCSSLSFALSVSGTDPVLVGYGTGDGTDDMTSFTYNSVELTIEGEGVQEDWRTEIGYLTEPATGSNTLQGTWASASDDRIMGGIAVTGADQSDQPDVSAAGAAGTGDITDTITTTVDETIVIHCVTTGSNNNSTADEGTRRWAQGPNAGYESDCATVAVTSAGSQETSWTNANASNWAIRSIAIQEPQAPATLTATSTAETDTSITMEGEVTSASGQTNFAIGFEYGIDSFSDSIFDATSTAVSATSSIGTYNKEVTGLTTFEEYGYRSYASTTDGQVSYGESTYQAFTGTISTSVPVVAADLHAWDYSSFNDGTHTTTTISGTDLVLDPQ